MIKLGGSIGRCERRFILYSEFVCRLQLGWASLGEVVDVDSCGMQKRSCSTAASVQLRERARKIWRCAGRESCALPGEYNNE